MTNFVTTFKTKAKAKELSSTDMLSLCIFKAVKAKSDEKKIILEALIKKAFSAGSIAPHRSHPYQAVNLAAYYLTVTPTRRWTGSAYEIIDQGKMLGLKLEDIFTEEEIVMVRELREYALRYK